MAEGDIIKSKGRGDEVGEGKEWTMSILSPHKTKKYQPKFNREIENGKKIGSQLKITFRSIENCIKS